MVSASAICSSDRNPTSHRTKHSGSTGAMNCRPSAPDAGNCTSRTITARCRESPRRREESPPVTGQPGSKNHCSIFSRILQNPPTCSLNTPRLPQTCDDSPKLPGNSWETVAGKVPPYGRQEACQPTTYPEINNSPHPGETFCNQTDTCCSPNPPPAARSNTCCSRLSSDTPGHSAREPGTHSTTGASAAAIALVTDDCTPSACC